MSAYFVAGTGTGIGKTYVTAGIIRALPQASAIKPIMSGYDVQDAVNSDAGILLAAMNRAVTRANIAAISPWRYRAPLSPDSAAEREYRTIEFSEVLSFTQQAIAAAPGIFLVEGVGGAMAPLNNLQTVRDWIAALNIPVLLVGGTYLGCISHFLTTAEALKTRFITIAAAVLSESEISPMPPQETAATVARFLPDIPVHVIPRYQSEPSFEKLAAALQ